MLERSVSGCTRTSGGKGVSRGSGGSLRISGAPPKRSCCTTVLPSVRSGSFCVDCSVSLLIACSLDLLSAHTHLCARTVFQYSRIGKNVQSLCSARRTWFQKATRGRTTDRDVRCPASCRPFL